MCGVRLPGRPGGRHVPERATHQLGHGRPTERPGRYRRSLSADMLSWPRQTARQGPTVLRWPPPRGNRYAVTVGPPYG
jgi:hypothetical protein